MPDTKWVNHKEALVLALEFLRQQSWSNDCDEQSARIIESNECINVLFKYKSKAQSSGIIISIEKISGKIETISLG